MASGAAATSRGGSKDGGDGRQTTEAAETGTLHLNQLRDVRSIVDNKSSLSFAEAGRAGKKLLARV